MARWRSMLLPSLCLLGLAALAAGLALLEPLPQPVSQSSEQALLTALRSSEGNFEKLTVQSWGVIDQRFHATGELRDIYNNLAEAAGNGELQLEVYGDELYSGITAKGDCGDGCRLELMIQSVDDSYEADETYLIVNLTAQNTAEAMADAVARANAIFAAAGGEGETNILLAASYDTLLSKSEKTKIAARVFADGGGVINESSDNTGYISRSGYYPGLIDSVESNSGKINLQVALFDNEIEKQTWIYLGTPLIFSEY